MSANELKHQAIPTNIITGFLGVGKTTTILHLLKSKPENERWAILVNEFGEIGVDGSLIGGDQIKTDEVYIREVPGGCMCCAAGLPMQIALNQLLTKAQPHRLLIEPTGLGHPKEVLSVLSERHYQNVLDIQKNITLVDARKLSDSRYIDHETFNQQIDIADTIIANKKDLYQPQDVEVLQKYITRRKGSETQIVFSEQGQVPLEILQGQSITTKIVQDTKHHHHHQSKSVTVDEEPIPDCGYVMVKNSGEGYQSVGWRFSADIVFNRKAVFNWLSGLEVERVKAVLITEDGIFGYNLTDDSLTELELDECFESRIEIIALQTADKWQAQLLDCTQS